MTNETKIKIASATRAELLGMVRLGWELETQSLDGRSCEPDELELDDEEANEYRNSLIAEEESRLLCHVLNLTTRDRNEAALFNKLRELIAGITELNHDLYDGSLLTQN